MKVFKLTNSNGHTRNYTQWGKNITHETNGEGELCGPGWLHFYYSAELAVLLNPLHVTFDHPILWECKAGPIQKNDRGLKGGTTKLTTIRRIKLPRYTPTQKVAFAIFCALKVTKSEAFKTWAKKWLNGEDRSVKSAREVYPAWQNPGVRGAMVRAFDAACARTARQKACYISRDVAYAAQSAACGVASAGGSCSFLQRCALKAKKIK